MSTQSIIEHKANMYYVEFREDYLHLCQQCAYKKPLSDGQKCKSSPYCEALILAVLESWTNDKKGKGKDLAIYMTYPQWMNAMYGMFGRSTIIDSLDVLLGEGLISKEPHRMFGKDTYKYLLNATEVNKRMRNLKERDPNSTHPQVDASISKRVASISKRVTRPQVNAYPSTSRRNIDTTYNLNLDTTQNTEESAAFQNATNCDGSIERITPPSLSSEEMIALLQSQGWIISPPSKEVAETNISTGNDKENYPRKNDSHYQKGVTDAIICSTINSPEWNAHRHNNILARLPDSRTPQEVTTSQNAHPLPLQSVEVSATSGGAINTPSSVGVTPPFMAETTPRSQGDNLQPSIQHVDDSTSLPVATSTQNGTQTGENARVSDKACNDVVVVGNGSQREIELFPEVSSAKVATVPKVRKVKKVVESPAKPEVVISAEARAVYDEWCKLPWYKVAPDLTATLVAHCETAKAYGVENTSVDVMLKVKNWATLKENDKNGYYRGKGWNMKFFLNELPRWLSVQLRDVQKQVEPAPVAKPEDENREVAWVRKGKWEGNPEKNWQQFELMTVREAKQYGWSKDALPGSVRTNILVQLRLAQKAQQRELLPA